MGRTPVNAKELHEIADFFEDCMHAYRDAAKEMEKIGMTEAWLLLGRIHGTNGRYIRESVARMRIDFESQVSAFTKGRKSDIERNVEVAAQRRRSAAKKEKQAKRK